MSPQHAWCNVAAIVPKGREVAGEQPVMGMELIGMKQMRVRPALSPGRSPSCRGTGTGQLAQDAVVGCHLSKSQVASRI